MKSRLGQQMLDALPSHKTNARLNRAAWHKPLISVVVTHHNYSEFVGDALASLLDQTHSNWECVVVDDASDAAHRKRLECIVDSIGDERIRLHPLTENVGQILAFFAALDRTSGDFVCVLDPDDRYAETFLEEALAAHLNEIVICPNVSTDQYLLNERGIIAGVYTNHRIRDLKPLGNAFDLESASPAIRYIPSEVQGWHWATTSSLMFRRAALNYLRPHKALGARNAIDAYLAVGSHALGGTLFVPKPLVYRSLHENNASIRQDIYSSHRKRRDDAVHRAPVLRRDVAEVLAHNGAPGASALIRQSGRRKAKVNFLAKWKKSLIKHLPFGKQIRS